MLMRTAEVRPIDFMYTVLRGVYIQCDYFLTTLLLQGANVTLQFTPVKTPMIKFFSSY